MFFQTSGVETSIWIPPLVALIISFFTSMGGISGAFLLLPFQMSFLGYTHPSVSATNQLFNVVAIPSGVYRYYKEGRMVWPLTWVVISGTLPGIFIGAVVRVVYLPESDNFKLFAAGVLFYVAIKLMVDLLKRNSNVVNTGKKSPKEVICHDNKTESSVLSAAIPLPVVRVIRFDFKRLIYSYNDDVYDVSTLSIFWVSFIVGIIGGVYGIGGGAIIAPFFVTFLGLPVYTVAGATLMGTFVTSVAGVIFYQGLAPFYPELSVAPDWLLGILFGLGGMVGMYVGARCQKFVPAKAIKWMIATIMLYTSLKYTIDFFRPSLMAKISVDSTEILLSRQLHTYFK